jgi:murein DD-endopeptidase MepM/ murein hydrolase activator NlpD
MNRIDPTGLDPITSANWKKDPSGYGEGYKWPVAAGRVTSGYGERKDADPKMHLAIDVAPTVPGQKGSSIVAAERGDVIRAGINGNGESTIEIKHPDGNTTVYNHQTNTVKVGDVVEKGQKIGEMDRIGAGPDQVHEHFEVRKNGDFNNRDDPTKYLASRPDSITLGSGVYENPASKSITNDSGMAAAFNAASEEKARGW